MKIFVTILTNSSAFSNEIGADESTKISKINESTTFWRILEIVSKSSLISAFSNEGIDEFITSEVTFVADNLIELDEEQQEKVMNLVEALEDIDDVQNVYHNMSV